MYECPNCAANLKFNIKKQMLFCDACETTMDPYAFRKGRDADEVKFYETTVYTCPQCAGELITDDETTATFCSFCGGSTILDSRISRERAPVYVIPFQKDKEDCKRAYKRMMRRAYFVPKALKDEAHIEKFRPIYMPFWLYSLKHDGEVRAQSADKEYHTEYLMAEYDGFSVDASAMFSDDLAEAIWPFDHNQRKRFTPSYLSGFYADTGDVDKDLYVNPAREIVKEDTMKRIHRSPKHFREPRYGWKLRPDETSFQFNAQKNDLTMFPVWFLSYRKKDRVAYAVMNGQTGKIAGDMPIAVHKYLISSFLWAVPIFLLLLYFRNLQPEHLLLASAFLSFLCSIVSNRQLSYLIVRDNKAKDRGYMVQEKKKKTLEDVELVFTIPGKLVGYVLLILMIGWPLIIAMPPVYLAEQYGLNMWIQGVIALIAIALILPSFFLMMWLANRVAYNRRFRFVFKPERFMYLGKKLPYLLKSMAGIIVAIVILCIQPSTELWYYLGALVCMVLTAVTFIHIIRYHNLLTTRKLPHLNRRGGDENV